MQPSDLACERLCQAVRELAARPWLCAVDPSRDFTRSRKIGLGDLLMMHATWDGHSIATELLDHFGWDEELGIRELKHAVGMRDPRTRDLRLATQELWGRVILHNACSLGMRGVRDPGRGAKHRRSCDRAAAFRGMRRKLRGQLSTSRPPARNCPTA